MLRLICPEWQGCSRENSTLRGITERFEAAGRRPLDLEIRELARGECPPDWGEGWILLRLPVSGIRVAIRLVG